MNIPSSCSRRKVNLTPRHAKEDRMSSRFFPLYNIDQAVGPGKPNMPDDVRLVQALLIELSRFDRSLWVQDVPAQARSLATSGSFSDTLGQWILALQRWAVKNFGGGSNF